MTVKSRSKKYYYFHADDTGPTVPLYDFHNYRQSRYSPSANLVYGNIFAYKRQWDVLFIETISDYEKPIKKSGIIFIQMTQDRQSYSMTFILTDSPTIPMVPTDLRGFKLSRRNQGLFSNLRCLIYLKLWQKNLDKNSS